MKTLVAILLICFGCQSSAQALGLTVQLPFWAEQKWQTFAEREGLTISTRINPFVWRGDFDGDGQADFAILVTRIGSKKEGIVLLLKAKQPLVLGAGNSFGNGGDDFSWLDLWHVEERGTAHGNYRGQSVRLTADGLVVAKDSSASALIYLDRGKPKWQQYGD